MNRRAFLASSLLFAGGCSTRVDADKERHDPLDQLDPGGEWPKTLRLGITPSTGESTADRMEPLVRYLGERLGIAATAIAASSYGALSEMVSRREVDLGVFSPNAYVAAREARVEAVAIATATHGGSPTYLGYLVMRGQGAPPPLSAARGATVAWVDEESTSGYLYPRAMLLDKGHAPDTFFAQQLMLGDHARVVEAVLDGRAAVGAVASSFVDRESGSMVAGAEGLVVIAKTRQIPLDCVVVHRRLPRDLAKGLRDALLALDHDAAAAAALRSSWGLDGFARPMHERYDEIERIRKQVAGA